MDSEQKTKILQEVVCLKAYHIYLLRHGLTQANSEGRYVGRLDEPLSQEGAEKLAELARSCEYPAAELYFASPKKRCLQTFRILYPNEEPEVVPELAECDFGDYEGKTFEELKNDPDYRRWASGGGVEAPPHGESSRDFALRSCAAFERIVDRMLRAGTSTAALLVHGGTIMAILGTYAFPRRPMFEWLSDNGMGYELLLTPQLWMNAKAVEVAGIVPEGGERLSSERFRQLRREFSRRMQNGEEDGEPS